MSRQTNDQKEQIIFRVMLELKNGAHSSIDFKSLDDAKNHVASLTSKTTAWWGIYEINPKYRDLKSISYSRLIPHKLNVQAVKSDSSNNTDVVRKRRNKSNEEKISSEKIKATKSNSTTSNESEDVKQPRKRKVRNSKSNSNDSTATKIEQHDNTEIKNDSDTLKNDKQDVNLTESNYSTKKKWRRKSS